MKRDCRDWAFITCSDDNFGPIWLTPSRYSRDCGYWSKLVFPSTRPMRAPLQGTPRWEPPPKERVSIFGEGCGILEYRLQGIQAFSHLPRWLNSHPTSLPLYTIPPPLFPISTPTINAYHLHTLSNFMLYVCGFFRTVLTYFLPL